MSTEEPSSLDRTFAGMLADLEDEHTRLTQRHDALLREADEVAGEIERVETVRAVMLGKPVRRGAKRAAPTAPTTAATREEAQAAREERVRMIVEYGNSNGGTFTGRAAAEAIGMPFQGVGPVLAGMVRRGEATVAEPEDGGPRLYTLVPA